MSYHILDSLIILVIKITLQRKYKNIKITQKSTRTNLGRTQINNNQYINDIHILLTKLPGQFQNYFYVTKGNYSENEQILIVYHSL